VRTRELANPQADENRPFMKAGSTLVVVVLKQIIDFVY
jgi:hypothetical protein